MNNVKINDQEVILKEYQGQRVVTFKDIDLVHGRPEGTARRNFNANRSHLVQGEDYFVRISYEAKTEYNITAPNGLIIITETGYLMLVKSFTDDLAWKVQRELVKSYFRFKETPKEATKKYIKLKYYNGHPVMTVREFIDVTGLSTGSINYQLKNNKLLRTNTDYVLLTGEVLRVFKLDNGLSEHIAVANLIYRSGVMKLIKQFGLSNETKKRLEEYFHVPVKENDVAIKEVSEVIENVPNIEQGIIFERLLKIAGSNGFKVLHCDLGIESAVLKDKKRIGLSIGASIEQMNYSLAYSLAQAWIDDSSASNVILEKITSGVIKTVSAVN